MNKRHAFTLIELLVVIAIIGIVSAMVINGIGLAQARKRQALVEADKQKLILLIDTYQSKLNFYPPDNGNLATATLANYDGLAATNPLLYELTGATNNYPAPLSIVLFDGTNTQQHYLSVFARFAVNNANQDAPPQNFFLLGPQPNEYTNYATGLKGLLVPVPLTNSPKPPPNFWHYDSSSTNRHNASSYDLWAEYISASKGGSNVITTNGNW